jgi:RNA polymerase sigma-70 factor (ECF subfamily)
MSDQDERALVERLRGRDEHALAELASAYRHRIFRLALRHLRNHEDAEEVAQDVLLKVYRKIDAFRGDSALSSWIYRITFNTAMSRLRRLKAKRRAEASDVEIGTFANEDAAAFDPPDPSASADASMFNSQLRARLAAGVAGLPDIYRVPVILRDLDGLSTEEASMQLRIKEQTLKSRLHRGRLMLRQQLADVTGGLATRPPNDRRTNVAFTSASLFQT